MKNYNGKIVGLRDRGTDRLVAVYPHVAEGNDKEIEDKVSFWFYQQSCSAEETLRHCYVDVLTEKELKEHPTISKT